MNDKPREVALEGLSSEDLRKNGRLRVLFPSGAYVDLEIAGQLNEDLGMVPVVLSGAVTDRPNKIGPFFSGRNLLSMLRVPGIMIADPSLDLDNELNLGWYAGNSLQPHLAVQIADILTRISDIYQLEFLIMGGSGGGFASLVIGDLLGDRASVFVWNPQTEILRYNANAIERYFIAAFGEEGDLKEAEQRIRAEGTITSVLNHKMHARRILYIQNVDDWHTQVHAMPFAQANNLRWMGRGRYTDGEQTELWLAEWGEGHAAPPVESIVKTIRQLLTPNVQVSDAFLHGFWRFPFPRRDQFNDVASTESPLAGGVTVRVQPCEDEASEVSNQPLEDAGAMKVIDTKSLTVRHVGMLEGVHIPADQSNHIYLFLGFSFPDGTELRKLLRGDQLLHGGS